MKKAAALILAMLLLSGCGGRGTPAGADPAAGDAPAAATETPVPRGGARRADVHFADMAYEHYEAEWFDEFTAPIYRLAEQGGGAAEFDEADMALTDELYYVHTLLTLAGLRYYAAPPTRRQRRNISTRRSCTPLLRTPTGGRCARWPSRRTRA